MLTHAKRQPFEPRVASSAPRAILQRKCACGGSPGPSGECEACEKKRLQRKADQAAEPTHVPSIVYDVLRSPGQPLDAGTRSFFEPRFGHDFSQVRVHTDGRAAESARSVNALAYTVGKDVVFGRGQYAPEGDVGRRLVAHELTHVIQQATSGPYSSVALGDGSLEAPANAAADAVMLGDRVPIARGPGSSLSRQKAPSPEPDGAAASPEPRSLRETRQIKQQSDEWLVREIELIRAWMSVRNSSSLDEERLLGVLSEAGTALLSRHPEIVDGVQESLRSLSPGTPVTLALAPLITRLGVRQAESLTTQTLARAGMRVAAGAASSAGAAGATGTGSAVVTAGGAAAGGVSLLGLGLWGFLIFVFFAPRGGSPSPELLARVQSAVTYAATKTKTKTQPAPAPAKATVANATCVSKAQKLSANGCNFVAVDPVAAGGLAAFNEQRNPQASEYCRQFTGNEPCEYWLYPPQGAPGLVKEWGRFDGFDGHSLIECKCGYDWHVDAAEGTIGLPFEQRRARGVLDGMIAEVLNHLRRAAECGVPYRMIVSSDKLKAYLIAHGIDGAMIEVVASELCD